MNLPAQATDRDHAVLSSEHRETLPSSEHAVLGDVTSSRHFDLVDAAYEEYCRLEEEGIAVDLDRFCARYPEVHGSLARMLEAHQFVARRLPSEEPHWPCPGTDWAGFELLRELGSGAFARVYLGLQHKMGGRLVALKISTRGDREAATIGPLEHPGVVSAYSVHEADGLFGVCMPYRGSATLVHLIDRLRTLRQENKKPRGQDILEACADPFDPAGKPSRPNPALSEASFADAFRWLALRLADALAFVHDKGIQHRDIKPSNILLQPDGTPLLLDFNLSVKHQHPQTLMGGTPLYMAPEQLRAVVGGKATDLDQRCDLFSLGAVLYELATGKHPFGPVSLKLSPEEMRDLLLQRQRQGFEPLRSACPDLPAEMARAIESCLALEPARRPQNAAHLAARLKPTVTWPRRMLNWAVRSPKLVVLLLAVALTAAVAWGLSRAQEPDSRLKPVSFLTQWDQAQRDFEKKDFDDAIAVLSKVLNKEPEHIEARFLRGRAYLEKEDNNLAIADFREMTKRSADGRAQAGIGYSMHKLKLPAGAVHYEAARKEGYRSVGLFNNLAVIYMTNPADWDAAQEALLEALKCDPKAQAPHYNYALLCIMRGMKSPIANLATFKKGLHHIELALAIGPPGAEMLERAADLCALAARSDRKHIEPGVKYLQAAVASGMSVERVKTRFAIFSADPGYEAVCNQANAGVVAIPAIRVLDPFAEDRRD